MAAARGRTTATRYHPYHSYNPYIAAVRDGDTVQHESLQLIRRGAAARRMLEDIDNSYGLAGRSPVLDHVNVHMLLKQFRKKNCEFTAPHLHNVGDRFNHFLSIARNSRVSHRARMRFSEYMAHYEPDGTCIDFVFWNCPCALCEKRIVALRRWRLVRAVASRCRLLMQWMGRARRRISKRLECVLGQRLK
jgi:hypothetical protein